MHENIKDILAILYKYHKFEYVGIANNDGDKNTIKILTRDNGEIMRQLYLILVIIKFYFQKILIILVMLNQTSINIPQRIKNWYISTYIKRKCAIYNWTRRIYSLLLYIKINFR